MQNFATKRSSLSYLYLNYGRKFRKERGAFSRRFPAVSFTASGPAPSGQSPPNNGMREPARRRTARAARAAEAPPRPRAPSLPAGGSPSARTAPRAGDPETRSRPALRAEGSGRCRRGRRATERRVRSPETLSTPPLFQKTAGDRLTRRSRTIIYLPREPSIPGQSRGGCRGWGQV